jgi:hypothetical protein
MFSFAVSMPKTYTCTSLRITAWVISMRMKDLRKQMVESGLNFHKAQHFVRNVRGLIVDLE